MLVEKRVNGGRTPQHLILINKMQ